jgi:superoxide dismutase, Fe-Mn family
MSTASNHPAGDGARPIEPAMQLALEANFGTLQRWCEAFFSGSGDAGAPGLRLVFLPREGTLVHRAGGHDPQDRADDVVILAPPLRSGGPGAGPEASMAAIDWRAVHGRYQQAVLAASAGAGVGADDVGQAPLIDVRRAGVFEQARTMIQGACWRDPASITSWAGELPAGQAVVVYCVHGHEVSRAVALRLRAAGKSAHFLQGGIEAWQAAGKPLAPR